MELVNRVTFCPVRDKCELCCNYFTLSSTLPNVWGHPKLDALGEVCESIGNGVRMFGAGERSQGIE